MDTQPATEVVASDPIPKVGSDARGQKIGQQHLTSATGLERL